MNVYTNHAAKRSQQRAIPPLVVDLLLEFGSRAACGDGTEKFYFDKPSRRKLLAYAGPLARSLADHLDCFALVAGGRVITVCHRDQRIQRDGH